MRVDRWAAGLPASAWTSVDVRDGANGPFISAVAVTSVLAIIERSRAKAHETLVMIRRCGESGQVFHDCSLFNAPPTRPRRSSRGWPNVGNASRNVSSGPRLA